jgi:5'-deoxynucleotidase YfbR-like HD superfamily hydrolase
MTMALAAGLLWGAWGQRGGRGVSNPEDMPAPRPASNADIGRAKAEREQNIKDATRLAELAEKVRRDLVAASSFTLSISTVKDADEMAKLSKKLHSRLKSGNAQSDPNQTIYDATRSGAPKK